MRKNYEAPRISRADLKKLCVLWASGIVNEIGEDGQLAPDIFGETGF